MIGRNLVRLALPAFFLLPACATRKEVRGIQNHLDRIDSRLIKLLSERDRIDENEAILVKKVNSINESLVSAISAFSFRIQKLEEFRTDHDKRWPALKLKAKGKQ